MAWQGGKNRTQYVLASEASSGKPMYCEWLYGYQYPCKGGNTVACSSPNSNAGPNSPEGLKKLLGRHRKCTTHLRGCNE